MIEPLAASLLPRGKIAPIETLQGGVPNRIYFAQQGRAASRDAFSTSAVPNSQKVRERRRPDAPVRPPKAKEPSRCGKMPPLLPRTSRRTMCTESPRLTIRGSWSNCRKKKKTGTKAEEEGEVMGVGKRQSSSSTGMGSTFEPLRMPARAQTRHTRGHTATNDPLRTNRPTNLKP